jgi:pseudouridine synthase
MSEERLQKLMAAAGVGSRRKCEELIAAGRVQVNGQVVTEPGTKADPRRDKIFVDGKPVRLVTSHSYFKLHKPRGVLGDFGGDEHERKTVADLLPEGAARVYPVGRLDLHSEGLVLMTDDGELAHRLTHPRYEHKKVYFVLIDAEPSLAELAHLRSGVDLPDGKTSPAEVQVVQQLPVELRLSKGPTEGVWLRMTLQEGKKRQIRQMTAAVGHPTLRLVRWSIGPLTMARLELGECAPLTPGEVNKLRNMAGMEEVPVSKTRPRSAQKGAQAGTRPGARPGSRPGARRTDGKPSSGPGKPSSRPGKPSSRPGKPSSGPGKPSSRPGTPSSRPGKPQGEKRAAPARKPAAPRRRTAGGGAKPR